MKIGIFDHYYVVALELAREASIAVGKEDGDAGVPSVGVIARCQFVTRREMLENYYVS